MSNVKSVKVNVSICREAESKEKHNANAKTAKNTNEKDEDAGEKEKPKDSVTQMVSSASTNAKRTIILQSASIWTKSPTKRIKAHVLFDTGSQRTFMTRRLASKLKCEVICKEKLSVSSFGSTESDDAEFELVLVGR